MLETNNNASTHGVHNPVVRLLVRSVARFMSAYFVGRQLFVYPPSHPLPLPTLHGEGSSGKISE